MLEVRQPGIGRLNGRFFRLAGAGALTQEHGLASPRSSLSFHFGQLSRAWSIRQRRQYRPIIYSAV